MVPTLILMSFASSFHFLAAKYLQDLRPYLVVLTLGNERIQSCRRLYLDERKVIRSLFAGGTLSDVLLFIVNSMSWILRVSMDGSNSVKCHSVRRKIGITNS